MGVAKGSERQGLRQARCNGSVLAFRKDRAHAPEDEIREETQGKDIAGEE